MRDHRLLFEKTGLGVYVSHLDLMRTVQRAFIRAGLHVKHTEGFNPRPHMVFALPLPVGCGSACELVDFTLESDHESSELCKMIALCLPEGIRPVNAYQPERKFKEIKWLRIEGLLHYADLVPENAAEKIKAALEKDTLIVRRKTKRGEDDFDLAPYVKNVSAELSEKGVRISAVISAQEPTINPALLISAVNNEEPEAAPEFAEFRRIELYDADMCVFR